MYAQESTDPVKENVIDRMIEAIAENTDQELDYTGLVESLDEAYENPIDLNTATREQLERLMLLSDLQIDNLQEYIGKHGALLTVYEIQVIPGWDEETVYLLRPFIRAGANLQREKWKWKQVPRYGKHELIFRYAQILESQKGFLLPDDTSASRYLGSPFQLAVRYRFTFRDKISIGFTLKKDRGEEFFYGSQPQGFDYYSAHIFIRDWEPFKSIALGDYQVQFGQGLACWKGFGSRKSMFVNSLRRFPAGLKPYSATNAFQFYRGAAAALKWKNLHFTGFVSYKFLDGNPAEKDTLSGDDDEVTALDETGYHRTQNELDKRNTLTEFVTGGNAQYKASKWNVGFTGVYTHYSSFIQKDEALYQRYDFSGNSGYNLSVDYTLLLGNIYFFGEAGVSGNGGYAFLQGVQAFLHPDFSLSFLYREYAKDYQSLQGQAFGDRSTNQNERGWYIGFEAVPVRRFRLNGYVDVFRFPWLRYNVDRPSWGMETSVQLTYVPSRKTELFFRVKHSLRQENAVMNDMYTEPLADIHKTSLRFNLTHEVSARLKLRSRVEAIFIDRPDVPFRWGFMAYQDVIWHFPWFPLDVSARIALFRTDDFDTRIYAYENDVLYSFSVPAFYDTGMRFYINLKYAVIKGLSVWFRLAQTYYAQMDAVGSGLDEIAGNTRTDITCQVRYRFGMKKLKFKGKNQPESGGE